MRSNLLALLKVQEISQMGRGNDVHKGHKVTSETHETNVINNLNDVMRMEMMTKVKN